MLLLISRRNAVGAEIELKANGLSNEALLFAETPSRVVLSFAADKRDRIREIAGGCPFEVIGKVSGADLKISIDAAKQSRRRSPTLNLPGNTPSKTNSKMSELVESE